MPAVFITPKREAGEVCGSNITVSAVLLYTSLAPRWIRQWKITRLKLKLKLNSTCVGLNQMTGGTFPSGSPCYKLRLRQGVWECQLHALYMVEMVCRVSEHGYILADSALSYWYLSMKVPRTLIPSVLEACKLLGWSQTRFTIEGLIQLSWHTWSKSFNTQSVDCW